MELVKYVRILWRWAWLIVIGVAVALGSTYLSIRDDPPIYEAGAKVMIGQVLAQQDPNRTDIYTAQDLATTYSQIALTRPVQEATRRALGLDRLPAYSVAPIESTQLLQIKVTDTDPARAAAVTNELATQLILQSPSGQTATELQQRAFIEAQLQDIQVNIDTTKAEMARLQGQLAEMFSAKEIADTQAQIAALQQKLNTYQLNYAQMVQVLGQGSVNTLSVVEPAVVPSAPIGPNKMRTLMIAGAIGLALALVAVFLLEYLDDTIKTPDDVDQVMHLTTLAGISRMAGTAPAEKLITVKHPKSPVSEAYRALRTNLQFSSLDKPLHTLLVTSPNPVEGKSTTVANLGVVMAQSGKTVVLVDADLRRPTLHRIFGLDNEKGLTGALLSEEPILDGHLQPTKVPNLSLLSSGRLPPNPSELLGSQRMAALLDHLKAAADVVIFDSPPAMAVTDASVLARQVDGVVLITDAGHTRRHVAAAAAERFRQLGANLLGVVLNRLSSGRGGYYYYYYYHYYYYGSDGKHRRRSRGIKRWLGKASRRREGESTDSRPSA